jgi:predicted DsbA family dithiol-disulfide isomerase
VEALYDAFFCRGLDIGDISTLATIANECGMDGKAILLRLESDEDKNLIEKESRAIGELGIGGVPFFIFNNKYTLSGAQPVEVFRETLDGLNM